MAEGKSDTSSYARIHEADADSIEVSNLRVGDKIFTDPILLYEDEKVKDEVSRILHLAEIPSNHDQYTFVVTNSNGEQIWLTHEDFIGEKLNDLTGPINVEVLQFHQEPRGAPPNMDELQISRKQ